MPVVKGACPHDCPDTCAWEVTVEAGRAVALRGVPDHPFTAGALCSKLKRYPARVYSPERILHPLRRVGEKGAGRFERVSWERALDEIAGRLARAIEQDGPLAVMPYSFAGTIGLLQRYAGDQFFARIGATGLDRDVCGQVAWNGVAATLGNVVGVLPEDLVASRLIVLWGTNTVVTNLHLWSTVIHRARQAGARVVVIDPVRNPTAARADQHLQIQPGTDAALALGLMHVIVRDGLHDADYLARHTVGFEALCVRLREYPPERVAAITGLAAAEIEALAREYASTRPAVIRTLVGHERYSNGHSTLRAIACLPALVGAWRERGGGLCQFTALLFHQALDYRAVLPARDAPTPGRTFGMSVLGRVLTDPALAPPVRWLMIYNSNPVVTAPNQNLIRKGLARSDLFTVVHEQFMTESARYADYLLPATTQFEHLELMPSWGQTYLALNQPAIAPLGEAIPNTELFRRLAARLGLDDPCLHLDDEARIRQLLASGSPLLEGITYERLAHEGWARLSLPGDWRPLADGGFPTPSGKCELYSGTLAARGLDPLPAYVPLPAGADDARYPLRLVSAKATHFLNSGYVNLRHRGTARMRPEISLNPCDAAARGIAGGDAVRAFNAQGEILLHAAVSADTPPGVASLPFNWWGSCSGNGASANALTPDGVSDYGEGSNAFDARIEVARAD